MNHGVADTTIGMNGQAWKTDAENVLGATVTNTPEYKGYGDPLAYVAGTTGYYTNTPATLPNASTTMESFVQSLAGKLDGKTAVDPSQTVANDNDKVVFSGLDEGLYLIVSKTDTEPATDAGSPLAIVGTQVTVNGTAYTKLGANNQTLGKAVVKPSTPLQCWQKPLQWRQYRPKLPERQKQEYGCDVQPRGRPDE